LPFQNVIDYDKLCVVIHVSKINDLEDILLSINRHQYESMFEYYETIKYLFDLEGMAKYIINENNK